MWDTVIYLFNSAMPFHLPNIRKYMHALEKSLQGVAFCGFVLIFLNHFYFPITALAVEHGKIAIQ